MMFSRLPLIWSIVIHLTVLMAAFLLPMAHFEDKKPPVMVVNLIQLPKSSTAPVAAKQQAAKKPAAPKETAKPTPKPEPVAAPEPPRPKAPKPEPVKAPPPPPPPPEKPVEKVRPKPTPKPEKVPEPVKEVPQEKPKPVKEPEPKKKEPEKKEPEPKKKEPEPKKKEPEPKKKEPEKKEPEPKKKEPEKKEPEKKEPEKKEPEKKEPESKKKEPEKTEKSEKTEKTEKSGEADKKKPALDFSKAIAKYQDKITQDDTAEETAVEGPEEQAPSASPALVARWQHGITTVVRNNWIKPGGLANEAQLEVKVRVKVGPDGSLQDAQIEQSSGNKGFDSSVLRAIGKTQQVDPPPTGCEECRELVFTFKPEE
ncbi:MAG: cell envelope integrity protein TolA [Magnetococcales bacterium]|nr:cell envelope integrity protein TolA [Magnetococcales bacterium]